MLETLLLTFLAGLPLALVGITVAYARSVSGGGVSIARTVNRTADGSANVSITLPAATAGTLTTRTDNDTGIITVASHSFGDTDTVDVYWSGGRRYGVDITAHTGTTISIDVGSGDNLPIATTAVTIVKQVPINIAIDGDNAVLVAVSLETSDPSLSTKGRVQFLDSAEDTILSLSLTANTPNVVDITGGDTNVYSGDPITHAVASNANSSYAATLNILALQDSTP
jgi:hypothetical protein